MERILSTWNHVPPTGTLAREMYDRDKAERSRQKKENSFKKKMKDKPKTADGKAYFLG